MADDNVLSGLTEIFRDVFLDDAMVLQESHSAADVEGWDSFKHIEIILAAEERFGVKFSTRELDKLNSVGDLANLIRAKNPAAG